MSPTATVSTPVTTWRTRIAALLITASLPFLLVMVAVRLVMSPLFLHFEYQRPGFPADFYGFTTQERMEYAPFAVNYLLNGEEITYLGDLRFPDGTPLYNARELHHMRDVKIVTQAAFLTTTIVGILVFVAAVYLWRTNRIAFRMAFFRGSVFTLTLIASIIILSILSWDVFFTAFHQLFFASGTWQFAYSDTLIRLFPEQFWFDAALVIGTFTALSALLILYLTLRRGGAETPAKTLHPTLT